MTQVNTSNIIAIGQLFNNQANRALYCGKQVVVTVGGKKVTPPDGGSFFVWDGCEACAIQYNFQNIDFSLPGLGVVAGSEASALDQGVIPGVSFQVTDVQVKKFFP